jgi:hypothetical protein
VVSSMRGSSSTTRTAWAAAFRGGEADRRCCGDGLPMTHPLGGGDSTPTCSAGTTRADGILVAEKLHGEEWLHLLQAREQRFRCGVSMSLGFGGNDSAVVIGALEG